MKTPQGVQLGVPAPQFVAGMLQVFLQQAHGFGRLVTGVQFQVVVDDEMGRLRADQSRQVALDAVTQADQLAGAGLVFVDVQVAQGLGHFAFCGGLAELMGEVAGEIGGRRGGYAADRQGYGFGATGLGRAPLRLRLAAKQRAHYEEQHIGRQGPEGGEGPGVPALGVFGQQTADLRADPGGLLQDGHQQHQEPDEAAGHQSAEKAGAGGPAPEQGADDAGQELGYGHEGDQAQFHQALGVFQQQVETVARHDDEHDEDAPGPQQPAVQIGARIRVMGGQNQVVQAHGRQR